MPDFSIKAGDRLPPITGLLRDANNNPIDLSAGGTSVKFNMSNVATGVVVVSAAAQITDAVGGGVQYGWNAGETATPGSYYGEWVVTFPSGASERFPNNNNLFILITKAVA